MILVCIDESHLKQSTSQNANFSLFRSVFMSQQFNVIVNHCLFCENRLPLASMLLSYFFVISTSTYLNFVQTKIKNFRVPKTWKKTTTRTRFLSRRRLTHNSSQYTGYNKSLCDLSHFLWAFSHSLSLSHTHTLSLIHSPSYFLFLSLLVVSLGHK